MYVLRRPNPYRPEELWYYKKLGPIHWTNKPELATFLSLEDAEKIGLEVLDEINAACEILGPYR